MVVDDDGRVVVDVAVELSSASELELPLKDDGKVGTKSMEEVKNSLRSVVGGKNGRAHSHS